MAIFLVISFIRGLKIPAVLFHASVQQMKHVKQDIGLNR
ncbi:MAG: hypothetical protein JWQ79_1954 [Mucilaginibacter sp.]|jgi:hypothetical protein|nr:hypothetical protein [Mucilaginibacter sp.]